MAEAAIIAGATGLTGAACVEELLRSAAWDRVIALVRRPTGRSHPRYEERVVDFDSLLPTGMPRGSDVFCALGTTIAKAGSREAFRRVDYGYTLALARRAVDAGADQFLLVSSAGANPSSSNFYLRTKGEIEAAVCALPFASVNLFRPGPLTGSRAERRAGERIGIAAARLLAPVLVGPLRKYHPIAAADVARAMVAAARQRRPGRHIHHYDQMIALARQI